MPNKFKLIFKDRIKPPEVDTWNEANEDEEIVKIYTDGIYIEFDKIFGMDNKNNINNFNMRKKRAYMGSEPKEGVEVKRDRLIITIKKYVNYFIKFYDKENDLTLAYLKMKSIIENYPTLKPEDFIKFMKEYLFTPTIIEGIRKMTEDNYKLNLEKESDETSKKIGQIFDDRIKITDFHAKILYDISTASKILSPVLTQYLKTINIKRPDEIIFPVMMEVIDIFERDVNIYNKLSVYAESRINSIRNPNAAIIEKREREHGEDLDDARDIIFERLVNGNLIKAVFNEDIVRLIYVIYKKQASIVIVSGKPTKQIVAVDDDLGEDEEESMTGADKIEIFMSKVDEGNIIKSSKNIESTLKKLRCKLNVQITQDEFDYYYEHLTFSDTQRELMNYFYSKYFRSSTEIWNVNKRTHIELAIMLKHYLLSLGYEIIPYCIVGNIKDKTVKNVKINKSMLLSLRKTYSFQTLLERYQGVLTEAELVSKLTKTLNKKFTIVDYYLQDKYEQTIVIDEAKILTEFVDYLTLI